MPRYNDERYGGTRLYVGHLSSRTRTRDLEDLFSRYGRFLGVCPTWRKVVCCLLLRGEVSSLQSLTHDGLTVSGKHFRRVRDVDMKHDFAFVDFSDSRDADDARYGLNGREVDGRRIVVEFARGGPRGSGSSSSREFLGRGPPPGTGRCFNCGIDGHWARDCKAGDFENKCYRCGERGHIERNCQNSPKSLKRADSRSRSPSRSPKPCRGRSRSRSYSRSRSPPRKHRHDAAREERSRSQKPKTSPVPSKGKSQSPSPDKRRSVSPVGSSPGDRREVSPPVDVESRRHARERHDSDHDVSPRNNRSPSLEEQAAAGGGYDGSPEAANGRNGRSSPPVHDDDDDDDRIPFDEEGSPAGNNLSPGSDD